MSESDPVMETHFLDDELLLELERAAEIETSIWDSTLPHNGRNDSAAREEYLRIYAIVDELAAPLRAVLSANSAPPRLPEYGELDQIGRGGMGVVYRGWHETMQRTDAIKVIRPDYLADVETGEVRSMRERFLREMQFASSLAHQHIVPVYQVGEVDGCPWFSMQLVEGENLYELCQKEQPGPEQAARWIECIAGAVDAVHKRNILHGDIKPQNILIERETGRPLITDFGLAELIGGDPLLAQDGVAGTIAYLAPELANAVLKNQSAAEVAALRTVKTDVYALGVTLWVALTGFPPTDLEQTPTQQLADVAAGNIRPLTEPVKTIPPPLLKICRKCLAEQPTDRYASAGELADALAGWLNGPRWHDYFENLGQLLLKVVAPFLFTSGVVIWRLQQAEAWEPWIWLAIFCGYAPLFISFLASQQCTRSSDAARRELWSIWIGHLSASLASLVSLRILCHPDFSRTMVLFYPAWAAISSVVFFAKSGNFWRGYRWIGGFWSVAAILLATTPTLSPLLFGIFAGTTCILIARGDKAFVS